MVSRYVRQFQSFCNLFSSCAQRDTVAITFGDVGVCECCSLHPSLSHASVSMSFCVVFKDTLRECRPEDRHCLTYLPWVSPIYFVTFVLMAQFVLVNVVVAVLMKHLEESNKVRTFGSD